MIKEIFLSGGIVMYPLTIFSITNLALIIHLVSTFRKFWLSLEKKEKNSDLKLFISNICNRNISPSSPEWGREYALFILPYENKLYWLQSNAALATLLGLFGTVLGIYSSFAEMKIMGEVSLEILAGGISEAIITTIFGLMIAIPSLFFFHYLKTKLDWFELRAEAVAEKNTHA